MNQSNFDSDSVQEWVDYIQTLHAREIELSLDRVRSVFQTMVTSRVPFKIISVAGTNGKGSTCEILASIYRESGYSVGKFTSPHLVSFHERFNINGSDVGDPELLYAFRTVEHARGDTPITYFEFGLLLAVALFIQSEVEVAVMEVGLGGRLDAVNILDCDVAIITSIAMDHTAWLGDTLEKIAFEKAGIARSGQPCIVGVSEPQKSMMRHFESIDALPLIVGRDFEFQMRGDDAWTFTFKQRSVESIPLPFQQQGVQLCNASLAACAVDLLDDVLPVNDEQLRKGVANAALAGRCQLVSLDKEAPRVVLDVSHNQASVERLAEFIRSLDVRGNTVAVCGMLKDKEISACLATMVPLVSIWHLASINATDRGTSSSDMEMLLRQTAGGASAKVVYLHDSVDQAWQQAHERLTSDDCLIVFGSFFIVGDILETLNRKMSN